MSPAGFPVEHQALKYLEEEVSLPASRPPPCSPTRSPTHLRLLAGWAVTRRHFSTGVGVTMKKQKQSFHQARFCPVSSFLPSYGRSHILQKGNPLPEIGTCGQMDRVPQGWGGCRGSGARARGQPQARGGAYSAPSLRALQRSFSVAYLG